MDLVTALDLMAISAIESAPETLWRSPNGWHGQGMARTAPFAANLAYGYRGLDLYPIAAGSRVGIGRSGQPYQWDTETGWQPVTEPTPYDFATLRDRLPSWVGPIQFWIDFAPGAIARELRLAYSLPIHDIPSYMRDFAIPAIASSPVELARDVRPNADGAIAIPEGIAPDRVVSALFLSPSVGVFEAIADTDRFITQPIAPPQPGKLLLQYRMAARGTDDNFDQIEDAPMVLIREIRRENTHYPIARSGPSVAIADDLGRRQDTEAIADSVFDIQVLARRSDEVRLLAAQLRGRLALMGAIDCLPYGVTVPIGVEGAIDFAGTTRAIGDLDRASFRLRAYQLPQSMQTTEVPVIQVIEGWWNGGEPGSATGQRYPKSWAID